MSLTRGESVQALLKAAGHIRRALPALDAGGKVCESCGLNVAHNIEERNLANQLATMVRNLERAAQQVGRMPARRLAQRRQTNRRQTIHGGAWQERRNGESNRRSDTERRQYPVPSSK